MMNEETFESLDSAVIVKRGSERAFGLTFAVFFSLVACLQLSKAFSKGLLWLFIAAIFLFLALLIPRTLTPFNWLWLKLGETLHRIMSPLMLGIIFYGVITPIGFLLRIAKKDILHLALDKSATTYWIEREPKGPAPETMKYQF